ncbi:MAG: hypothetical protein ORN51_10775 [Akkermansiaceae bacterium]|nr:hypothetical protein [Akkermansiaceae bacterium]
MLPATVTSQIRILATIVGCLGVGSCSSAGLFRDLEREQTRIAGEAGRIARLSRGETRLTWNQACGRLLREDFSLRQAEDRLADLKRQRKDQWKEWLPRPSLYVNLQNSLKNLGDVSGNQLSSAIYAPLVVPNPWTQAAKAYQYALQEVQATDSLELTRRRQVIFLYRSFAEWGRAESPLGRVEAMSVDAQLQAALRSRENDVLQVERMQMLQGQMSRMLNLPETNVVLQTETLPAIDYERRLGGLIPGKNYGQLATRLSSYDIQAALLRRKGIDVMQWPSPNLNASVPPVYDSHRQGSQIIDSGEQISLFGSWSKSFDLTGREALSIKSADDNVVYVRELLRVKLDGEGRSWDRLKARYAMLIEKRGLMRERLAAALRGSGSVDEDVESARGLIMDLENLERAKQALDMEVWLWDDNAWK